MTGVVSFGAMPATFRKREEPSFCLAATCECPQTRPSVISTVCQKNYQVSGKIHKIRF